MIGLARHVAWASYKRSQMAVMKMKEGSPAGAHSPKAGMPLDGGCDEQENPLTGLGEQDHAERGVAG